MPVRHDVHRTRCAALLTDEAPAIVDQGKS